MAAHYSVPSWRLPGTEEPGKLQSMGSNTVGHGRCNIAAVPVETGPGSTLL